MSQTAWGFTALLSLWTLNGIGFELRRIRKALERDRERSPR